MIGTDISFAKKLFLRSDLVAIPTETVYGLAANAFDTRAVLKIYEVKNRPQFNPLIIHSNSIERFESWGIQMSDRLLKLAHKFSPGPLTYVVKKSDMIPDIITAGNDTVAIRIPNHEMTLELLSQLDFPLAAPSANPSEYVSPTTAQHVEDQLSKKIKYVLDGGPCNIGLESTIVDLSRDKVRLLRLGAISKEQIEECLNEKIEDLLVSDNILAPGMMKRHYATSHKIIFEEFVELPTVTKKTRAIRFNKYSPLLPESQQILLSKDSNLYEAASKLFAVLRELDKMDLDFIIAEKFPNETIGRAINDRLNRAASNN